MSIKPLCLATLVATTLALPGLAFAGAPGDAGARAMPDAHKVFDEAVRLIDAKYVDGARPDDQLWTAALEGVLDRLVQVEGVTINALLSPADLAELRRGLAGSIVGVGVVIEPFEQVLFVKQVIPGGPAADAGVQAGDRILAVDGASVRGLSLADAVDRIRGPKDSKITLMLQRDTEEWEATLTRAPVRVDSVFGQLLDGGLGYVRIDAFGAHTVARLDAVLAELKAKGPKGLVLDLRGCPGGRLEVAVEVADRFLDRGETVVTLARRGGKSDVHRAKVAATVPGVPIAVLVDHESASGAEILAAALTDHRRAILVGERTLGKGSVEELLELSNGWALKLTVARMVSPNGTSWHATGLAPGFPVGAQGWKDPGYTVSASADPDHDAQLKAAMSLLQMGR
ncbi:MAG: S41 family peptidase [Deltaproteobacteria bacterium]|nr:MAG: S41 family peptidase [Deltaproteobacteria bacterium]